MSFFLFFTFHLFHSQSFSSRCVSACECVCVCTCLWACCMCLRSISTPWSRFRHQHILHLSLSLPRHLNFLQTSFTSVPWRTDTSSPLSPVPVCLCHSFPPRITFHLSACLLSAVSPLFTISPLLHLNQSSIRKSYNTVNSFRVKLRLL